eukprot:5691491-Pyramimonas_sp.AAC.1
MAGALVLDDVHAEAGGPGANEGLHGGPHPCRRLRCQKIRRPVSVSRRVFVPVGNVDVADVGVGHVVREKIGDPAAAGTMLGCFMLV